MRFGERRPTALTHLQSLETMNIQQKETDYYEQANQPGLGHNNDYVYILLYHVTIPFSAIKCQEK